MTTYAMPSDSEGRLIGPAVEQVRELVAEAASPSTDVDPGVLHAATCFQMKDVPVPVTPAEGGSGTAVGNVSFMRRGVAVKASLSINFDQPTSGSWMVGPAEGAPGVALAIRHGARAMRADLRETPIEMSLFEDGVAQYQSLFTPPAGITWCEETVEGITSDPAPDGSY